MRLIAVFSAVLAITVQAGAFSLSEWEDKCARTDEAVSRLRSLYSVHAPESGESAAMLSMPVEIHPNGAVKTLLTASRAKISTDSEYIWGEGVTIVQFSMQGATQTLVNAQNCIVDREKRIGWVKGRAVAEHFDNRLTGSDVYVSIADFFVSVYSNALVETGNVDFGGGENGRLVLSGARASYDRDAGVVMFSGDVKLDDGGRSLECDKAYAFLEGTNDVRRVVALGGVKFGDGQRTGGCPRAVYDKRRECIEMHSDRSATAFIEESGANKWRLEGRKIIFWPRSGQIEVAAATIFADVSGSGGGVLEDIIK